jgi:hypothetical protein
MIIAIVALLTVSARELLSGRVLPLPTIVAPVPEDTILVSIAGGMVARLATVTEMYERNCVVVTWAYDTIPSYTRLYTSRGSPNDGEQVGVPEGRIPESLAVTMAVAGGSVERIW